jgi:hypothetical protein
MVFGVDQNQGPADGRGQRGVRVCGRGTAAPKVLPPRLCVSSLLAVSRARSVFSPGRWGPAPQGLLRNWVEGRRQCSRAALRGHDMPTGHCKSVIYDGRAHTHTQHAPMNLAKVAPEETSILIHSPGGTCCPGNTRCHSYDGTKRGGFVPGGTCSMGILPPSANSIDSCSPRNVKTHDEVKTLGDAPAMSSCRARRPSVSHPQSERDGSLQRGDPCRSRSVRTWCALGLLLASLQCIQHTSDRAHQLLPA